MAEQTSVDSTEGATRVKDEAKPRRNPAPLIILIVLAGAGYLLWRLYLSEPAIPANVVFLSGRIEGDDSAVAAKTTARLLEVRVREGDELKAGDVVAVLDDPQLGDRRNQARAALAAAAAHATSAKAQIAVLEQQLRQNQLTAAQSNDDAQGRVSQAEADLTAAQADLNQQEASLKLAVFDRDAYTKLVQTGAVSERQGRLSVSTADQQEASVSAAKRRVEAARGALGTARANLANPAIRQTQVASVQQQIIQQQAEIASSMASAEQARFLLSEAEANQQDLTVKAPFSGTVITRSAEPGEVVSAGTAIITLLDLNKVYLRGFVPEGEIGKVKMGQTAHVYLDSNTKQALDAVVSRIDPQATFTPENTYFRDDRIKQVVGVKLLLKSGIGFAKPGMPSDGQILVQGDSWPAQKGQK
jgi:HlyD family secretion protein